MPRCCQRRSLCALAPVVEQGVAWAAIKPQNIMVCMQHAEVGNAADVQHAHCVRRLPKDALVKHWDQGRALPARCDVAATEIGHHIDAGQLSQQRWVVELPRVARAIKRAGLVTHGLSMGANGAHIVDGCARVGQQGLHSLRIHAHQAVGGQSGTVQFVF